MEAATLRRIVAGIVVVICVLLIIHFVLDKVRKLTGIIYGINSLLEGMKAQEIEYANTPKNVSSGTSIYLPQIMRDFPEFHLEEMKQKAEEIMKDVYNQILAISTIAAIVTAAIALLMLNFSKSDKTVTESRAWLKRIIITWAILNGLGFIMAYITPFFADGRWNG